MCRTYLRCMGMQMCKGDVAMSANLTRGTAVVPTPLRCLGINSCSQPFAITLHLQICPFSQAEPCAQHTVLPSPPDNPSSSSTPTPGASMPTPGDQPSANQITVNVSVNPHFVHHQLQSSSSPLFLCITYLRSSKVVYILIMGLPIRRRRPESEDRPP